MGPISVPMIRRICSPHNSSKPGILPGERDEKKVNMSGVDQKVGAALCVKRDKEEDKEKE